MRKTIADMFREEGEKKGRQERELQVRREMLLELLQNIGDPDADVIATIEQCDNPTQLQGWFRSALAAESIEDVGIQNAN